MIVLFGGERHFIILKPKSQMNEKQVLINEISSFTLFGYGFMFLVFIIMVLTLRTCFEVPFHICDGGRTVYYVGHLHVGRSYT